MAELRFNAGLSGVQAWPLCLLAVHYLSSLSLSLLICEMGKITPQGNREKEWNKTRKRLACPDTTEMLMDVGCYRY